MIIGEAEFILKNSLGLKDVRGSKTSELKCLKCGARAYLNSSYVTCTSGKTGHQQTNKDYITNLIDLLDATLRAKNDETIKGGSTFL